MYINAYLSYHQRRLVISSTQTCPRPLSPLWQSAVITLAVAFRLLDRATTDILQSQQSRLRWRISLSAEEFCRQPFTPHKSDLII